MRDMAESVIPPGLAPLGIVTPEKALKYIPSYRWRQIGEAYRGKTPVGIESKESKMSRTARAITATWAGLSLYPMKIQYNQ
jgi:hypothetical protein